MTRAHLIAALLLFFPLVAFGVDENLAPDGENGPTNVFNTGLTTACSATTCEGEVDEDADGAADNFIVCTEATDPTIRFDFPQPSLNPSTATNAQALDLIMTSTDDDGACTEDAAGTDASFTAELYCNGSATGVVPFSFVTIATEDEDHRANFTFPGACASNGSDFQVLFTLHGSGGSPAGRRWAAIEAVQWEVTHAAVGGARRRTLVIE